jgi:hypothetical protein
MGFFGLGVPIVGEMHPLWSGTSESARERCMTALGIEKVESGGRTVYKRNGNTSDSRRVKGLLTHVLSVLSDCGFSPSAVKNKRLDEICGMYEYIMVYKGLLRFISVCRSGLQQKKGKGFIEHSQGCKSGSCERLGQSR